VNSMKTNMPKWATEPFEPMSTAAAVKSKKSKAPHENLHNDRCYGLRPDEWTDTLQTQINGLREFWTSTKNPVRMAKDTALETESFDSNKLSNIKLFLGYCKHVKGFEPNLQLYDRPELMTEYGEWMEERQVRKDPELAGRPIPTLKNMCATGICVAKYLHYKSPVVKSFADWWKIPSVHSYRSQHAQVQNEMKKVPLPDKDNMRTWVEWEEVVNVRRKQHQEYLATQKKYFRCKSKNSKQAITRQKLYANAMAQYIALVLWTSIPPVRSQVLRGAIMSAPPKNPCPKAVYLWYDIKKERLLFKYGKLKTENAQIPLPNTVTAVIHKYMTEVRPLLSDISSSNDLVKNNGGPYLFVGKNKQKQMSVQRFSGWVSSMFQRHGVTTTAHILRHAKVTHKIETGATAVEMVAMSKVMGQTVATQQAVYNRLTPSAQMRPALDVAAEEFLETYQGEAEEEMETTSLRPAWLKSSAKASRKRPREETVKSALPGCSGLEWKPIQTLPDGKDADSQSSSNSIDSQITLDDVYVMDEIKLVKKFKIHGKDGMDELRYLCSWVGFSSNDDTWEPEDHLTNAGTETQAALNKFKEFHEKHGTWKLLTQ